MISAVSEQFNRFVTFAENQRAKGAKTAIATMGDVAAKGDTPLEERAIKITDKSDWVGNVFFRKDDAKLGNKMPEFTMRQLNSVYFALSQSALGSKLRGGFYAQGINSNEHMALTFTLVKDANSGDVKIRYSEPTGFPLHFSWETTVHIDGSSESTNMVVEVPEPMA